MLAPMTAVKRAAFLGNPLARGDREPAQIIATAGDRVIGRIDLLAGQLTVGGVPLPVFWGSSLFVDEEHRSTGAGLKLLLKMQGLHHTVTACGISPAVVPIYDGLRWTRFTMPRYALVLRSRAVVRRFLGKGLGARMARPFLDGALRALRIVPAAWSGLRSRRIRVREVARMPVELDTLLQASPPPAAPHRSAAWINWLLENRFEDDVHPLRKLCLIEDRSGAPLGYFLVNTRFVEAGERFGYDRVRIGSLQDWRVFEPATLTTADVALLALRSLADTDIDVFAAFLPEPGDAGTLRSFGFVRFAELDFLFRANRSSPLAAPEFKLASSWRMRPADGDNFFS
jgi:hypothetical protein